jgi:hypothetical protein
MAKYAEEEARINAALLWREETEFEGPLTTLAKEFRVSYKRLQRRARGLKSKSTRQPANRKLDNAQEEALITWLKRCDKIGVSARVIDVHKTANSILARCHNLEGPAPNVSKMWVSRFISRHPEWYKRPSRSLDAVRAAAEQPARIGLWYSRFEEIVRAEGIPPEDIWNMDETSFRVGIARTQHVLTQHPEQRNWTPSSNNRETVTVVEAISAAGATIQPMVILPGKRLQDAWFTELHSDTMLALSDTGYTTDALTLQWLYHWEEQSRRLQRGVKRLLVFDGYGSHYTLEFVEFCEQHAIVPLVLPPHMSHLMQPLDVAIFQPFKHWHSEAVDYATRSGCIDFNKTEFLAAFEGFRQRTMKPDTIRAGFAKTGLYPFNPNIVLSSLREKAATLARPATPVH